MYWQTLPRDRPGVFRLNVGASKETYRSLFGPRRSSASRWTPSPTSTTRSTICSAHPRAISWSASTARRRTWSGWRR
ncbi:DUF6194 family protein [Sorangium sp. So ce764]|uniref:DUF6194 family protein n=1 Tax=Sorangium sp. So ce764 TaxID=3133320 RepID=UPI003F5EB1A4